MSQDESDDSDWSNLTTWLKSESAFPLVESVTWLYLNFQSGVVC